VFTGLIAHVGDVVRVADTAAGREFSISAPWTDLVDGESIAVDGVCLTVTGGERGAFSVSAVSTTLACTTLGAWRAGRRVNLERALRASDRLGGHMVQGHVDGVGTVKSRRDDGSALLVDVALWDGAEVLCVPKGSITIDGVSLTIHELSAPRTVTLSLIDHTRRHTTLGDLKTGDVVHVELDVIGKYVRHLLAPWGAVAGVVG
jgi:riboflavin synthase